MTRTYDNILLLSLYIDICVQLFHEILNSIFENIYCNNFRIKTKTNNDKILKKKTLKKNTQLLYK